MPIVDTLSHAIASSFHNIEAFRSGARPPFDPGSLKPSILLLLVVRRHSKTRGQLCARSKPASLRLIDGYAQQLGATDHEQM